MTSELVKMDDQKMSKTVSDILKKNLQNTTDGIDFEPPRYTIDHKGLNFLAVADDSTKKSITGVIVANQKTRGIWKEGEKAPECSSADGRIGREKLVDEIRQCATCPKNQWGSHGGNGKACKEMRRLLIVENTEDLFPIMLTLPPTSIKIFDRFISNMIHKKIVPLMTNIKFTLEKAEGSGFKYAKIKLELGEPLTMAQIEKVAALEAQYGKQLQAINIEEQEVEAPGTDKADDFTFDDDPNNEHLPV